MANLIDIWGTPQGSLGWGRPSYGTISTTVADRANTAPQRLPVITQPSVGKGETIPLLSDLLGADFLESLTVTKTSNEIEEVTPIASTTEPVREEAKKVDNIVIRIFKAIGEFFLRLFSCGSNPTSVIESGHRSTSVAAQMSPVLFDQHTGPVEIFMSWNPQGERQFTEEKKAVENAITDGASKKTDFLIKEQATLDSAYDELVNLPWSLKHGFTRLVAI